MLTGAGTLALANPGKIQYASGNTVTISNTLSGSNLSIINTSVSEYWMTLFGSNQLTGTTTIGPSARVTVKNTAAFGTSTIDCGTGGGVYFGVTGTFSNDIRIGFDGVSGTRGPLRFELPGVTLTGTITLQGNSSITFNGSTSGTIAGPINETGGSRSLIFGTGSPTLTGASTYTGATTNYGSGIITLAGGDDRLPAATLYACRTNGTLKLFGISQTLAGLSGSAPNAAIVGGSSTVSSLLLNFASGTYTFNGMIGGAGANQNNLSLTKAGAGTQVLSGTNTYSGATTVSNGTLQLGASFAASTNSAVTVAGGVYDLGTLVATNKTAAMSGGAISNGTLVASSFTFSGGTAYAVLAGAGALTNVGGTTTLAGTNTYTGATVITNGTLVVNGLYAGGGMVTVLSNATLQGTSPISNLLCLAGGILSAPATNAILTVGNGGTLGLTNAVLAVTVDAAGNSGKLAVDGNLVLTNCTLSVTGTNLLDVHKEYTVATWTGTGTISPLTGNLPSGWHAVAEANRIVLQGAAPGFVLRIQ
jgi:autotransporter-associated beta strand protein